MEKKCFSIAEASKVSIGRGILTTIKIPGFVVVIADEKVADLYRIPCDLLICISNEKTKENYESIIKQLFLAGANRHTTLVAIGGGTICDLVGFVAATFMRGIPLILIPTTLLAIVDASIGGKTAIDTPFGKNLIGSIYFPKMIYSDLDTLKTLPESEWINGMAEILKMGLIFDPTLFAQEYSDALVEKSVLAKIAIVEKDPYENDLRRILNFGHTLGHGLEKLGEEIPHGQAVALGSLAESHLSMALGFLSEEEFEKIQIPYQKFNLRLPTGYSRKKLYELMRYDKKKKDGFNRFVLIDQIGRALPFQGDYCYPVSQMQLEGTLDWLELYYG